MIVSRHIVLSAFCILGLALPAAAQTQNNNTVTPSQNAVTAPAPSDSNTAINTNDGNNTTAIDNTPRPVPKRLTAEERWNRMSPEQRSVIINEWLSLDETIRPVFPVFRDSALDVQAHQQGPIAPAASVPASQPVTQDANVNTP